MFKIFCYTSLFLLIRVTGFAQEEHQVEKSSIIENIDGKDYYLHFVKKGETLFAIARAYDINVNDIFKANPGSDKGINPGRILKIPVKKNNKPQVNTNNKFNEEKGFFYHIVKKNETFYGITRKYGISLDDLKTLNPGLGEYPREGETLKIPVREKKGNETEEEFEGITVNHTVINGETLYGIAKKYNVTTGEIINANPGVSADLQIGQVLHIPNQVQPIEKDLEVTTKGITENPYTEHIVLKGENLYRIAKLYGVSIDTLKKINPDLNKSIEPGQIIKVPKEGTEKTYIIHNPEKKKKLEEIAKMYNVDYNEVSKMNPEINRKAKRGQHVKIPVEPAVEKTDTISPEMNENPESEAICKKNETGLQRTFNVALMLPLFLEEADSLTPEKEQDAQFMSELKSFRFLDFYAGFKMAVDSMQGKGMKLNLFIYDVDQTEEKANQVLRLSELASMDLIIGPLYSKSFAKVSAFAKTYEIPIINPLSEREEIIYDNPYVFKLRPSEEDQLDVLVSYLEDHYPDDNIVIVRHNKYKYQKPVSFIRNSLNTSRKSHIYISNRKLLNSLPEKDIHKKMITENKMIDPEQLKAQINDSTYFTNLVKEVIYVDDSMSGLKKNLSAVRKNIVVAISNNIVFSKQLLSELNKLSMDHDITLFGLPEWKKYEDLESSQLINLHFHCFTHSAVNYNNLNVQHWIRDFRKKYNTEPSVHNFAFDGFDTGWYFLNALFQYGPAFNHCLQYIDMPLLQTKFEFEHTSGNGYRNSYWNLGEYNNYRFRSIYYSEN